MHIDSLFYQWLNSHAEQGSIKLGLILAASSRSIHTAFRNERDAAFYSGSMICPLISKFPLTDGMPVPGCPPPSESVYLPCATTMSPASVTMLRSRGFS